MDDEKELENTLEYERDEKMLETIRSVSNLVRNVLNPHDTIVLCVDLIVGVVMNEVFYANHLSKEEIDEFDEEISNEVSHSIAETINKLIEGYK